MVSYFSSPVSNIVILLLPVRRARRDKPHWDSFGRICEVVKRKPSTLRKRCTFNDPADSGPRAKPAPSPPAGMTIKKIFFVFYICSP